MILSYSKDVFVDLILADVKIHTLREDPKKRWRAGMSIQHWRGNPRNVKQNPYKFKDGKCANLQSCLISRLHPETSQIMVLVGHERSPDGSMIKGGRYLFPSEIQLLAKNDGLTMAEFIQWFVPPGFQKWEGRIIHFTDFLY